MYIDVAVEVPAGTSGIYTYAVPAELAASAVVGAQCLVPLGRAKVFGYIVRTSPDAPEFPVKAVLQILGPAHRLAPELIDLALALAAEYRVPLFFPLELMRPSFLHPQVKEYLYIPDPQALPAPLATALGFKKKLLWKPELAGLLPELEPVIAAGLAYFSIQTASYGQRLLTNVYRAGTLPKTKQRAYVHRLVAGAGELTEEALLAEDAGSKALFKAMVAAGELFLEKKYLPEPLEKITPHVPRYTLAEESLAEQLAVPGKIHLLTAPPNKFITEFLLAEAGQALARRAAFLIIAPTNYAVEALALAFEASYPGRVARYYGVNSPRENFDTYYRLAKGAPLVTVASPLGLFLPFARLGGMYLAGVDAPLYRTPNYPYFDLIAIARRRAALAGIPLYLASPAPGFSLRYQLAEAGAELYDWEAARPGKVTVIDLYEQGLVGATGVLTPPARLALERAKQAGKTTLIIGSAKAYATQLVCHGCGAVLVCPRCRVGLREELVKGKKRVACPACGQTFAQVFCPGCRGSAYTPLGGGIEKLYQELLMAYPSWKIYKATSDNITQKSDYAALAALMTAGEADVVIATTLIYQDALPATVGLAVVLNFDSFLAQPSYLAREGAFALLARLATAPELVIQTASPALARDYLVPYKTFYERELALRRALRYPPFTELFTLAVRDPYAERFRFADYTAKVIRTQLPESEVLRPYFSYEQNAVVMVIKTPDAARLAEAVETAAEFYPRRPVKWTLERKGQ